ncbi:MAG TPA: undecaprenyl-diphosphate phosphatase [Acidobacteriaceae bacterium]|nr:undecaprenyl-diphosphate phosphatase [Acidobacteriaceae bacterium]
MTDYWVSVLLGIVEGLTEFLPVSSTAHLRIAEALLNIPLDDAYWKMYSIVIQLGAILALTLLFLGRIIEFVRTFPEGEDRRHTAWNHPLTLTLAAFVVTAIPSFLLTKVIGEHLENLHFMALALIIGGIIMWIVDAWSVRQDARVREVEQMSLPQAVWIGACQITSAVFPGTSRSMSTIAAGQLASMTRSAALEFSFLLSIPTMIAATLYDLARALWPGFHLFGGHHAASLGPVATGHAAIAPVTMTLHGWMVLAVGFVVSFFVALGVVEWFLQWVRNHGFVLFAVYRLIIGAAVLTWGARLMAR